MKAPDSFCAAPWTHTYCSPQGERRLCCASREQATWQKQYIDADGKGDAEQFSPISLLEHWNSDKMKRIRLQMLNGEAPDECQICNQNILNLYTYKKYFNETLFAHKLEHLVGSTNADGSLDYLPVSFDYRISNLCNFKCRMCGEQLSSSWESEKRKHGQWNPKHDKWMIKENRSALEEFKTEYLEKELWAAVKEHRIEEIYWVGGEPLMWDTHWEIMSYLDKEYTAEEKKAITIRYNSNLSRTTYKDYELGDLLFGFKNVNFCASIDGVGAAGEYIRTGLKYEDWKNNFKSLLFLNEEYGENGLVLDVTLTLPGIIHLEGLYDLAQELSVKSYIKTTFAFDASVLMSPMCLPRELLDEIIDEKIAYFRSKGMNHLTKIYEIALNDLKGKPVFSQSFGEEQTKINKIQGKRRLEFLDKIRESDIRDYLKQNTKVLSWWENE